MGISNPSYSTSKPNAWDRWAKIWHAVFYVTLGLPTLIVLIYRDTGISLGLVLGLSLALGLWYVFMIIWLLPRVQGNVQQTSALVFLVGALVMWIPLANAHPAYYLTASSFYGLMWGTLRFSVAIAGNVILTLVIVLLQSLSRGGSMELSANMLIIGAVIIGWSVLLALWIRTIMRESVQRKRLIEKLEAAQEELAAVERLDQLSLGCDCVIELGGAAANVTHDMGIAAANTLVVLLRREGLGDLVFVGAAAAVGVGVKAFDEGLVLHLDSFAGRGFI